LRRSNRNGKRLPHQLQETLERIGQADELD
jgi:hypothetical protein